MMKLNPDDGSLRFDPAVCFAPDSSGVGAGAETALVAGGTPPPATETAPAGSSTDGAAPQISRQPDDPPEVGSSEFDFPDEDEGSDEVVSSAPPAPVSPAEGSAAPAQTPATTTSAPVTPAATPAAAPAPATTSPPATAAPATSAPVAPAPVSVPAASPTVATPAGPQPKTMLQLIDEGRMALEKDLAETRYKLPPADVEALEAGDPAVVPRLLAKAHVENMRQMAEIFEQVVPHMVSSGIAAALANRSEDDSFYGVHKDLADHRQTVFSLAGTLRQLHPNMPKEQFVPLLATTARATLGLPMQPGAVSVVPVVAPVVPARGASHQPVVTSVPTAFAAPRVDPNDWGAVNDMFDSQDA